MSKFHCRGEKKRIALIKTHDILPVAHMPLLKGQTKYSAAEDTLIKEYYSFAYKRKNIEEDYKTFICGTHVAKHFFKLLRLEPLPIFNILKNEFIESGDSATKELNNSNKIHTLTKNDKWDKLAIELYNAINIILMTWNANTGVLSEILIKIRKNCDKCPELRYVKALNTIISKDSKHRNIFQMLDGIRKNNEIKDYIFPLIDKTLKDNNINNNITQ
jgi:hypothetical protein